MSSEPQISKFQLPMRVDVERVRMLREELRAINALPLKDIEFYENGVKMSLSKESIEHFTYLGLNNTDFVMYSFYKDASK